MLLANPALQGGVKRSFIEMNFSLPGSFPPFIAGSFNSSRAASRRRAIALATVRSGEFKFKQ